MKRLLCLVVAVAALCLPMASNAQLFRAYLSINGSDANPCTLPKPCRLLTAALPQVANNGEIWMLDSANYNTGTVTIDRSVTILAVPGALGSIVSPGLTAPAIDIATPGITVTLRNVSVIGLATQNDTMGITLRANSQLIFEDSILANLSYGGATVSGGTLIATNATFRNVAASAVLVTGSGSASISRSRFVANSVGFDIQSNGLPLQATIADSAFLNNATGVKGRATNGAIHLMIDRSEIEGSGLAAIDGANVSGSLNVYLNGNSIRRNPVASIVTNSVGFLGTAIFGFGNNVFLFNGTTPTLIGGASLPAGSLQ